MIHRYQRCDDCGEVNNADDLHAVRLGDAVCAGCWRARVAVGDGRPRLARPVAAGTRRPRGPLP